jgi:hypothetical protein
MISLNAHIIGNGNVFRDFLSGHYMDPKYAAAYYSGLFND